MIGTIVKSISDFYYIYHEGETYQCKAKGIFKKKNHTPLVGDRVEFELTKTLDIEGNIVSIFPRKSVLNRPSVANIDVILLTFAAKDPEPNFYLLDRFLAIMEDYNLEVIIVFNKEDLDTEGICEKYKNIYQNLGYKCISTSTVLDKGLSHIKSELKGKTASVAGPSGVGKSSIINTLTNRQSMETGEVSKKNKRGKQTTRHTELVVWDKDSFIVDTPGFSSTDITTIKKEDLDSCFLEFRPFLGECKFSSCAHIKEPDCAVKKAFESGKISSQRYENYVKMYEELQDIKQY